MTVSEAAGPLMVGNGTAPVPVESWIVIVGNVVKPMPGEVTGMYVI